MYQLSYINLKSIFSCSLVFPWNTVFSQFLNYSVIWQATRHLIAMWSHSWSYMIQLGPNIEPHCHMELATIGIWDRYRSEEYAIRYSSNISLQWAAQMPPTCTYSPCSNNLGTMVPLNGASLYNVAPNGPHRYKKTYFPGATLFQDCCYWDISSYSYSYF